MKTTSPCKPIDILLVEDSPTDVLMTREALEFSKVMNRLFTVEDGVQAMEFLRRKGKYAEVPRPDLVLLDLNLPRKGGREVLAEIKADPALKSIPVVILSTSKADEDIAKSYDLHANCYVAKPVEFYKFAEVIQSIREFWFGVVSLPRQDS